MKRKSVAPHRNHGNRSHGEKHTEGLGTLSLTYHTYIISWLYLFVKTKKEPITRRHTLVQLPMHISAQNGKNEY